MNRNNIATLIFGVSLVSFVLFYPTDNALPPSTAFTIKRIQETVHAASLSSPEQQLEYASELLDRRLHEIISLLEQKKFEAVVSATSKHSAQAYDITMIMSEHTLMDKDNVIHEQFNAHREILRNSMPYIPEYEATWQSLLQAADSLDAYESQLTQ